MVSTKKNVVVKKVGFKKIIKKVVQKKGLYKSAGEKSGHKKIIKKVEKSRGQKKNWGLKKRNSF